MIKHGKKYNNSAKLLEKAPSFTLKEAVELAKKAAYAGFDETVEVHLRMGVDPRNAEQQVRGIALLPNGLGKKVRILVFAQGEGARIATEAGAEFIGDDETIKKIEGGWTDFDVSIATPDLMGKVGRLGKVLGRKGLMPNPKSGTVVPAEDLPRAIADARKGRVEFRLDRTAIIHVPIGKISFDETKLNENLTALLEAILKSRPASLKGQFIKSAFVTSTMGPGIRLDLKAVGALSGGSI
ncbi:MAG: 50S ribosomal protein L1 [Chloroflexi bacterium RBG_16_48_7]|nr:MAG: 50S ribosomal protein L1 [Chloroflexi bacterium RBG_16_48_7]